jgi:hypothetical protein
MRVDRDRSYRKIYEEHHNIKIPKGMHIHHIDGNRNNNDISNLEMLTPDEHAQRHGYISNFIMAQDKAMKIAIEKLKTPEIREKMRKSMLTSESHKKGIQKRSENERWRESVSEACRKTAKNRTNEPWNKGKKGVQKTSEHTKALMTKQRTGRKWYNDGEKTYFIRPEDSLPHYRLGRV